MAGPWGPGGGPGGPGRPNRRRLRRRTLAIAAAGIIAVGALLGIQHGAGQQVGAVLTTHEIATRIDPGLVDVVTTLRYQGARAAGTGMVLSPSGMVLTNNHVIEGATSIQVRDIGNGRTYQVKVVGYDRSNDVAVLQMIGASGLQTVRLGDSAGSRVGDRVTGIGNALGKGGKPSVVTGRILRLNASVTASDEIVNTTEQLTGMISHNAPIQPGDSGGPLVNSAGQVIGIDTAASNGRFQLGNRAQAFAIPINKALSIANNIEAGKASATIHIGATGFLGVEITAADQAARDGVPVGSGAAVAATLPGAPAAAAGLASNDVIVSVDHQKVGSPLALQTALEEHHPGDKVIVGWTDQFGRSHSAPVTLAAGPAG